MSDERLRVRGVLQAGGKGERMAADGRSVPKPLVEVRGVPMAERLLRQFVAAGIRDVTIITGWMGDRVEDHLRELAGLPDDLAIDFIRETRPRGNVGSLYELRCESQPVLMAFADLVTDLDFAELVMRHDRSGAQITLTSHFETHRVRLGELQVDGDRVTGYQEKPEKRFLICSGIAIFDPSVLDLLSPHHPAGISDLVGAAINHGHQVVHWNHGAFWMDVNFPEELEIAEREVAAREAAGRTG